MTEQPSAATILGSVDVLRCPKCASEDINTAWHGPGGSHRTRRHSKCSRYAEDWGKPEEEHLHYTCRNCQYAWTGVTADAEVA